MAITKSLFGTLDDGREAWLFDMRNANGMRVTATNYGGAIVSIWAPDKDGGLRDVALGLDTFAEYNATFFGVVAGRVANRIGGGRFTLDGKPYQLEKNDGGINHLHGGSQGFNRKLWQAEALDEQTLCLTLRSPDGDSGYPGALDVRMTYTLTEDNVLRIEYLAEAETKTVCNLTNHSFFNLEGHDAGDVYGHVMVVNADQVTEVDKHLIPTGVLKEVTGTAYDFRQAKPIGKDIAETGMGYDDNYVLNGTAPAASVYAPASGIKMTVRTDSPGVQLYTGNFLNGRQRGKGGAHYQKHGGFCLETQIFPDAINHPHFPSCVVEPGRPQRFFTEYAFSCGE